MKTKYILEVSFAHDPEFMRMMLNKAIFWQIDAKARMRRVKPRKKAKGARPAPRTKRPKANTGGIVL